MTEETIFKSEEAVPTNPQTETPTTPQPAAVPPELVEWVGEGKKYKSLDEVYKAFPNAQNHIATQQQKIEALEAELERRKSAEDVLNEIRSNTSQQQKPTSQGVEVNESVLSELVEKKFSQYVTQQQQDANLNEVVKAFTDTYADKREDEYKRIAQENGLSLQEMNQLAAKSPKLVLKLAGFSDKKPSGSPMLQSDVNTAALANADRKPPEASTRVPQYYNTKDVANVMRTIREQVLNNQTN